MEPICFAEQRLLGGLVAGLNLNCKLLTNDLHTTITFDQLLTAGIWTDRKTKRHRPANLAQLVPVFIGPLRHLWIGKKLFRKNKLFHYLAFHNIIHDYENSFPDYLTLPIVKKIQKEYRDIPSKNDVVKAIKEMAQV